MHVNVGHKQHARPTELGGVIGGTAGSYAASGTVGGISNPVPSTLARVIAGDGPFPTLGLPGSKDVFVTAADDIAGLNASKLSKLLAIDPSNSFTVIKFATPDQGVASPINRTYPQFVGGGLTAGGAREFVIPNQSVPQGATIEVVR